MHIAPLWTVAFQECFQDNAHPSICRLGRVQIDLEDFFMVMAIGTIVRNIAPILGESGAQIIEMAVVVVWEPPAIQVHT